MSVMPAPRWPARRAARAIRVHSQRRMRPSLTAVVAMLAAAATLAACGSSSSSPAQSEPSTVVHVAQYALHAHPVNITVPEVPSIRAKLPKAILKSGKLVIGAGFLPAGTPPLGYIGTNQTSLTGDEPDLGRLVSAVFGLQPEIEDVTFQNLFVRLASGQYNVAFSNVTDTEQRQQEGLAFACYRKDQTEFEVLKSSKWNFDGNYKSLAGQVVAVKTGTDLQEVLLVWQKDLQKEGKSFQIRYFNDENSTYLALDSGRITVYYTSSASVAYHMAQDANSQYPTRGAGTESSGGPHLQGLICATTEKTSGLVQPVADAINYLIKNGDYAKWLAAYGLQADAVSKSLVNPPGLPLSATS